MLIFVDLETTGLEVNDVICSIAVLTENAVKYELINEGKKIPPLASSIHHITNEMIQGKKPFQQGSVYNFLEQNNSIDNTLIVHNAKFALEKLAQGGLHWQGDIISTLKVTKHLIRECELFSLEFLRYELKLYTRENNIKEKYGIKDALCAHNALNDLLVTKLLFDYLLDYAMIKEMKELSFKNVLLEKFTFGKYMGKYIEEISMNDKSYLEWMLSLSNIDEDLKYSLEYYLKG